ncbi:MAG: hypothetical protein U1C57_01035 [Candidatus Doudnabacteria bacterium]|nr:hypothetical protein [Candidatus Doudnabacteria bacterium]
MYQILTLSLSSLVAFFAHHHGEKFLKRRKNIRLILKGYHIHHSLFGAMAIFVGIIFSSGLLMFALLGYGLGNIWQHKYTHNKVNEKGMVFVSRISK